MKSLMSVFRRMSIRSQILILAFIVAAPAMGIIIYSGIHMREDAVNTARMETQHIARNIAEEQQNLATSIRQLMMVLTQLPDVENKNKKQVHLILNKILRLNAQYSNILIADREGNVWVQAIAGAPSFNVSDRRYFKKAVSSNDLSSGEYIISRTTTYPTFNVAYAFRDDKGVIGGVIIVGIVLSYYKQVLERSGAPANTSFILLDHKGVVLYRPIDPDKYIGRQYDSALFREMQIGPDVHTYSDIISISGDRRIVSYRKLRLPGEHTPYMYIRVGIPVREALAKANSHFLLNLILFTLFMCVGIIVAWLIGRRSIADRVIRLEAASQKMAEGDLDVRISELVAGGELGRLGQTFDLMAQKLKNREKALIESEHSYRTIFNATRDAIFLYSMTPGKIVELNSTATEMFGHSREEMLNVDLQRLTPDESASAIPETIQWIRKAASEGPQQLEWQFRRKNGERFWSEVVLSPAQVRGDECVMIIVRDITQRKLAELALKKSEAMQRKLLANIGDVIVIIDKDGINRYKSPNIEKRFGWKPEEVVGAKSWDNIHPDDLDSAIRYFGSLMSAPHAAGTVELRYKCKDGSYRWIEFTGSNFLDDPDIQGVLGNYHDIMERKQAEQNLRESEARFKALHNASFGGIAIHDKGFILDCNQGLSEITGFSVDELIGMDGLLLIAPKARDSVMKNIVAGYEEPYESTGVRKDGTEYPLRLEARNVPYKGKMVRSVEFRDITQAKQADDERTKLQDQLIQAQKMESVGRLAGGVAHDYNNMLSVILGHVELALMDVPPTGLLRDKLIQIQNAARRSADITRQLLTFARKQTISPRVIDINTIIESMFNMLRHLIGEDIEISWHPGKKMGPVKVDPSQIEQILVNLCVNARDAIGGVGKILIETQMISFTATHRTDITDDHSGEFIMLGVSDDGCGMNKEILDHIFEPFFTTKGVTQGTGLGLATVYGIVQQNNGFIKVHSEPGHGTTFRIYLPCHPGDVEHLEKATVPEAPLATGETVLVVEDEPAIREMCGLMLEKLGYRVLTAENPEEALRIAKAHEGKIDLLLTDVVMPGMNGREMTQQIRTLYPEIRTLFMSGYTADVIAHRGVLEEEVQFLQKPFSIHDLGPKIREILKKTKPAES